MFPPNGENDIHPWEHGAETGVETATEYGKEAAAITGPKAPTGPAQGTGESGTRQSNSTKEGSTRVRQARQEAARSPQSFSDGSDQ